MNCLDFENLYGFLIIVKKNKIVILKNFEFLYIFFFFFSKIDENESKNENENSLLNPFEAKLIIALVKHALKNGFVLIFCLFFFFL